MKKSQQKRGKALWGGLNVACLKLFIVLRTATVSKQYNGNYLHEIIQLRKKDKNDSVTALCFYGK